jgi:hypothetical protein
MIVAPSLRLLPNGKDDMILCPCANAARAGGYSSPFFE